MPNLIAMMLLAIITASCAGYSGAPVDGIGTAIPESIDAPARPTRSARPDYDSTAERAGSLATAEMVTINRDYLSLEQTQAALDNAVDATGMEREWWIAKTLASADSYAILQGASIAASATLEAVQLATTSTAQILDLTQIVIDAARATQTADAPMAYMRQRAEMTELSVSATEYSSAATIAAETDGYYRAAGKWAAFLGITVVFGFFTALILSIDARRRERLMKAAADAARVRVISGGQVFAGDYGAQAIPSADTMRPIYNLSDNAGYAAPPQADPQPARDVDLGRALKLVLGIAEPDGTNIIPSRTELGWKSASEWQLAVDWLKAHGMARTEPNKRTYVTDQYSTVGAVIRAIMTMRMTPPPSPPPPSDGNGR